MEAVAHNSAFAKKAGVPRSVGKDYVAADKGKKFAAGGMMKKKIRKFEEGGYNGPADVPKREYSKAAEDFLKGADRTDPFIISRMKKAVPQYNKAPVENREVPAAAKTEQSGAEGESPLSVEQQRKYLQGKADAATAERDFVPGGTDENDGKPVRATTTASNRLTGNRRTVSASPAAAAPARAAVADSRPYTPVPAAVDDRPYTPVPVDEAAAARRREAQNTASPGYRALSPAASRAAAQNTASPGYRATRAERAEREAPPAPARAPAREVVSNDDEPKRRERPKDSPNFFNQVFRKLTGDTTAANTRMKKGGMTKRFAQGGMMKESKAMVGKEMNFMKKKGAPKSMMKHEAAEMGMKKGGMHKMPNGKMMKNSAMNMGGMMKYAEGGKMPMKDGKPAFIGDGKGEMKMGGMAKAKKMMGGGMSGYAKGGGIESRGKTKGTVIKMATGGSVSSRADGIAQRGKTKGRMI